MSVVVSDTSPLHYLILCGAETALPRLFSQVVIPPTVFRELQLEAICLAQEIKAAAVLMDDRAGRSAAISCGLAVIGTIGLLEQAAARGFLDLPQAMERLRQTNARLDLELIHAALKRDKARKQARQGESE